MKEISLRPDAREQCRMAFESLRRRYQFDKTQGTTPVTGWGDIQKRLE